MQLLAEHRPGDAVLSEEAHRGTASAHDRRSTDRVWIIDPLDGTREFSEPPRDNWAVHVALWARAAPADGGDLVAVRWPSPDSVRRSTPAVRPSYPPRP